MAAALAAVLAHAGDEQFAAEFAGAFGVWVIAIDAEVVGDVFDFVLNVPQPIL